MRANWRVKMTLKDQMHTDGSMTGRLCSPSREAESPTAKAEAILKADAEHRSLAADQILMLQTVMPAFGATVRQLSRGLFHWFQHQGFWDSKHTLGNCGAIGDPRELRLKKAEKIALIHSEVSELLEAVRKEDYGNEAEELADVLVRVLDYAGGFGIELGEAFREKMLANYARPFKHGKQF
jgi:NTP pyrophosphatase (non-canonical NTP hydrolase)